MTSENRLDLRPLHDALDQALFSLQPQIGELYSSLLATLSQPQHDTASRLHSVRMDSETRLALHHLKEDLEKELFILHPRTRSRLNSRLLAAQDALLNDRSSEPNTPSMADCNPSQTQRSAMEKAKEPTSKHNRATQRLGPGHTPHWEKSMMQEREDSEDTISYESNSDDYSDTDQTMSKHIMPKGQVYTHTKDMAVSYAPNAKLEFPQKTNISPHKPSMDHTTDVSDLPEVPKWFPARIKRILNDDGCPDALPFKVSNYEAQLRTFPPNSPPVHG